MTGCAVTDVGVGGDGVGGGGVVVMMSDLGFDPRMVPKSDCIFVNIYQY